MDDRELIRLAYQARASAHAPYSGFRVGASLLTNSGKVYTGCNIENASYGASNCAERTAFFKAVSEGEREFQAIAVVGGKEEITESCPPCGICRQGMMEFCNPDTFYILFEGKGKIICKYLLRELLPEGFGAGNLAR